MAKTTKAWYASWFDTPYYHILYKDRNDSEAQLFMDNLTSFLKLSKSSKVMDLACGKGRHSIYLNTLGYHVTGVDLSEKSITHAKQFENDTLKFDVHDMTKPYHDTFNAVFNLFTSFGYFEDESCNLKAITSIKENLKTNGFGVIDFMNTDYVLNNLVNQDVKTVEGITFTLKRNLIDGYIVKDISFEADNEYFNYQERVRAFKLQDFKLLFEKANVTLCHVFGDYNLNSFDSKTSERLIMVFQ